jgi:LPPG:FO 2-phospho-L-lactate transferase
MTHTLAISGGVGGAKLALGLARTLEPDALTIVANTGDDFDHLGLRICPDLDTVMYTLADLSNRELGWGLAGETWQFLEALAALGGETWFRRGSCLMKGTASLQRPGSCASSWVSPIRCGR